MWPFVRPKPEPAMVSPRMPAPSSPPPQHGKNVEVVTNLDKEILLRLTQDGFGMTLKMNPKSARELAGLLDGAADALDPQDDDDDGIDSDPVLAEP